MDILPRHRQSEDQVAERSDAPAGEWMTIRRDQETGIESVHAHFEGHAYDPHDHDEMLVGVTLQGVQRFRCGRAQHTSTIGKSMLIAPGAVHDGHAPAAGGFTYAMLYLPQPWLADMVERAGLPEVSRFGAFRQTLVDDAPMGTAIWQAFQAVHQKEGRLARDLGLDRLTALLSGQLQAPAPSAPSTRNGSSVQVERAREVLHASMSDDIGLDQLASHSGMDRFRLSRQFKQLFGQSPHAYLVQLRLRAARALLASGREPAQVAIEVGFADQSHMGRWFQRAYRITPAAYRRACTNVLD
jgi:AraC-like DNA-binding protein